MIEKIKALIEINCSSDCFVEGTAVVADFITEKISLNYFFSIMTALTFLIGGII
jgi:hypothetical protein